MIKYIDFPELLSFLNFNVLNVELSLLLFFFMYFVLKGNSNLTSFITH